MCVGFGSTAVLVWLHSGDRRQPLGRHLHTQCAYPTIRHVGSSQLHVGRNIRWSLRSSCHCPMPHQRPSSAPLQLTPQRAQRRTTDAEENPPGAKFAHHSMTLRTPLFLTWVIGKAVHTSPQAAPPTTPDPLHQPWQRGQRRPQAVLRCNALKHSANTRGWQRYQFRQRHQ